MTPVILAAVAAVLMSMLLCVIRGVAGPTVYDRILAVNTFGTHTVIMIGLVAFLNDEMGYLDVAITYALINFISTLALLKYFKFGSLGKR